MQAREQYNFRGVDWKAFNVQLGKALSGLPGKQTIGNTDELEEQAKKLSEAILQTVKAEVSLVKPSPYYKRWWMGELKKDKALTSKLGQASWMQRAIPEHPVHLQYHKQKNTYKDKIRHTKAAHWEKWLENADD